MTIENINALDEAKLLGYFESIKSVFLLKLILLTSVLKTRSDGQPTIDTTNLGGAIREVKDLIDDPIFYKSLEKGNLELVQNFQDDIGTSLFISSWIVFEQITKDLVKTDYATQTDELSVCYQNKRFEFSDREKRDIALFYYIRNAVLHYNGAYYAASDIDHRYDGVDFRSNGHHGEKIDTSIARSWKIATDIQRYTIKAWSNAKRNRSRLRR